LPSFLALIHTGNLAMRFSLLRFATGFIVYFAIDAAVRAEPPKRLNLLLITADDMNADSSGWMGSKLGATPNLDAFARTGHRLVNHHVSAPICQPSRSALMTGRVPHRNGALGFNPINTDVPTLVEVLAKAGYHTSAINKIAHMAPASKFPWHVSRNGSGKNPKEFGQHVAECLKAAKDAGKPFFLNANITDPHRPFPGSNQPKAKKQTNAGASKAYSPAQVCVPSFLEDIPEVRKEVAEYFTGVRRFDESFGQVIEALKAAGHADDTLIVFLSDHGMSFPFSKATVYRNGTWSPVILRWPGMPAAVVHPEFVSSVDLMPTLLDILSVKHPEGMDGRSWLPILKGESQPDRDFVITHVNTVSSGRSFPQRCVRTKNHSLMFHGWADGQTRFRVEAMNGRSFNALAEAAKSDAKIKQRVEQFHIGTPLSFFDLQKDPDERNNLIADPNHRAEIDRLAKLLVAHMDRTNDPQTENFKRALRFVAR
jgi:N-sulfoglucosamine sulfohydrolase